MTKRPTTDEIFNTLTSDAGLNKHNAALFHAFNPNGAVKQLPDYDEFFSGTILFVGLDALYSRANNYHAKAILKFAQQSSASFTRWELNYHIKGLREDAAKARAALAAKRAEHFEKACVANPDLFYSCMQPATA